MYQKRPSQKVKEVQSPVEDLNKIITARDKLLSFVSLVLPFATQVIFFFCFVFYFNTVAHTLH